MSQNEDEYSLETPVDDVNSTVYPTAVHSYHTPSKLHDAITYAIVHNIREGYYEELFHVDHRH